MKPSHRNSSRSVPQSNLEDRALGVGNPNSADKSVGKQNARYSRVNLTGGGAVAFTVKEYDVLHDLGQTPTSIALDSYERASGPVTITARGVRPESWSHTHAVAEVTLIAGSLDDCVAVFLVKGR